MTMMNKKAPDAIESRLFAIRILLRRSKTSASSLCTAKDEERARVYSERTSPSLGCCVENVIMIFYLFTTCKYRTQTSDVAYVSLLHFKIHARDANGHALFCESYR